MSGRRRVVDSAWEQIKRDHRDLAPRARALAESAVAALPADLGPQDEPAHVFVAGVDAFEPEPRE